MKTGASSSQNWGFIYFRLQSERSFRLVFDFLLFYLALVFLDFQTGLLCSQPMLRIYLQGNAVAKE